MMRIGTVPTTQSFLAPAPPAAPGVDARLLIAQNEAFKSQVVGEVVDASIERMAEARERREAERLEEDRQDDRLRAIERREKADAERVARNAERRAAEFRLDERAGDADAAMLADREQGEADDARRRARGSSIDLRA